MLFLLEVPNLSMKKSDDKVKEIKESLDDDWKRLEKWHFGRANFP